MTVGLPAKQTTPSAPCRLRNVIKVDWSAQQEARMYLSFYVTIYWTSDDCDGQAILTLHLFPYCDHCYVLLNELTGAYTGRH